MRRDKVAMIAVAGEALIDLVVGPGGQVDARPGGGPYNAARTLARLGAGRRSSAAWRGRLRPPAARPAGRRGRRARPARAVGQAEHPGRRDPRRRRGSPSYAFYLDGTAAADVAYAGAEPGGCLPEGVTALHVGTLGLLMEPVGAAIERLVLTDVPPGALVFLDPNCRPGAVPDADAYRARIGRIAAPGRHRQGEHRGPGLPVPGRAARGGGQGAARAAGAPLVLVTDGPARPGPSCAGAVLTADAPASRWRTRSARATRSAAASSPGGRPTAWAATSWATPSLVARALRAAAAAAALTCTRPGADPPTLAELQARTGGRPTRRCSAAAPVAADGSRAGAPARG